MKNKVEFYLKRQFRWMISAKRKKDFSMMHYYEHELDGAVTALFYAESITESQYRFLTDLIIRITCGKRR